MRFFTGTDPVGLTVADLTGNGVPDIIVANAGSNDLSIFLGVGQGADWTLEPRPRLQVGNDPVSTTVADVYGNSVPDIICVDQGSDDVEILRGIGGGFFDVNNPLVLPAGPGPIRAFIGRFDAGPGPDLAVLDSGSSDLTDYPDFVTGDSAPQTVPTGGPSPVAGVMGSSEIDGYAVLFIAHQGDNQITVLQGSSTGFVLADSISLGQSVQPSDLAVSGDGSGNLDLYVSAQGQDRVILVNVTSSLGTSGALPSGGYSTSSATTAQDRTSSGLSPSANPGSLTLGNLATESSEQGLVSVQAPPASVGLVGTSGQVAMTIATIATALQQIITPSIGSLTFFNNFVQMGQVQITDIMSLDHSATETVAVLLVVSGPLGEGSTDNDLVWPGGDESEPRLATEPGIGELSDLSPGGSNLERFLSDLDGAFSAVPRDLLEATRKSSGAWPEWVWQTRDPGSVTVTGADAVVSGPRNPVPDPEPRSAPGS